MKRLLYLFIVICTVTVGNSSATPDGADLDNNNDSNSNKNNELQNTYENVRANSYSEEDNNQQNDDKQDSNNWNNDNDNKNDYNSPKNNNGYKNKQSNLAKVILQPKSPNRLDEIYSAQGLKNNRTNSKQQILLYVKLPNDCDQINPFKQNSLFNWSIANGLETDNAAVKCVGGNNNNDNEEYGGKKELAYGEPGYLKVTTIPLTNIYYREAVAITKKNFAVGTNERILGRMKLSCKADVGDFPFNKTEASHPYDDPRLANCRFEMSNVNGTYPSFYFIIINKSVWAAYVTNTFVAKRKVGIRERYDDIVDAGLELDKRLDVMNYYLNGYKVWSINAIGAPPPDDGITNTDYGQVGTPALTNITEVSFLFGTSKCLDESDPYTPDTTRLERVLDDANDPYYGPNAKFYFPNPPRSVVAWGEYAIMKIYKFLIIKAESQRAAQQNALPGVYGSSSNKD